jgi:hypothetical protein
MTQIKLNKYYTGIGTRDIDEEIIDIAVMIGVKLAEANYVLRSGAAPGCDTAFEMGCDMQSGKKEIYTPWKKFSDDDTHIPLETLKNKNQAEKITQKFHPAWNKLSQGAKKLHTRNVYQVLGNNLNTPSKFIICYTKDGKFSGGTGQALRIADSYNIPIFNLYYKNVINEIEETLSLK